MRRFTKRPYRSEKVVGEREKMMKTNKRRRKLAATKRSAQNIEVSILPPDFGKISEDFSAGVLSTDKEDPKERTETQRL